mgnify:FL=1
MEYTIEITGDELEELQQIIEDIKRTQPASTVTEESYVENLVVGYLRQRVAEAYVQFVKQKSTTELKALLGTRKEIKGGN